MCHIRHLLYIGLPIGWIKKEYTFVYFFFKKYFYLILLQDSSASEAIESFYQDKDSCVVVYTGSSWRLNFASCYYIPDVSGK